MAQEGAEDRVHAAPAAPTRPTIYALGAAAVLVLTGILCYPRLLPPSRTRWRGAGPEAARLLAEGVDGEPEAARIQLGDGARAIASSPASRRLPSVLPIVLGDGQHETAMAVAAEARSVQPIDIPLIQRPGEWRRKGHGISLDALGEPKSGTTWLGRLVPQLALELCGSWNNLWCEMGGLAITERVPAPSYEFEMISKNNTRDFIDEKTGKPGVGEKTLFLHYKGTTKHVIPGMDKHEPERRRPHDEGCEDMARSHHNGFCDFPPCRHERGQTPTRETLVSCLWSTSQRCVRYMTSVDPDVRRSFVIFRDPRDVVISEYRMRTQVFNKASMGRLASLDHFVRFKFEILVSWIHQRWVWHSGNLMKPSSFLVYYEEAQKNHLPLMGMAAFMGLQCSEDQALTAWKAHENKSPHGDYTTYDLPVQTIEWMNATMARLLPPPLALRYGVSPTDL